MQSSDLAQKIESHSARLTVIAVQLTDKALSTWGIPAEAGRVVSL